MDDNHKHDIAIDIGIDPIFTDIFGDEVSFLKPAKPKAKQDDSGKQRLLTANGNEAPVPPKP